MRIPPPSCSSATMTGVSITAGAPDPRPRDTVRSPSRLVIETLSGLMDTTVQLPSAAPSSTTIDWPLAPAKMARRPKGPESSAVSRGSASTMARGDGGTGSDLRSDWNSGRASAIRAWAALWSSVGVILTAEGDAGWAASGFGGCASRYDVSSQPMTPASAAASTRRSEDDMRAAIEKPAGHAARYWDAASDSFVKSADSGLQCCRVRANRVRHTRRGPR